MAGSVVAYGPFSSSNIYVNNLIIDGSFAVANTSITFMNNYFSNNVTSNFSIIVAGGFFGLFGVSLNLGSINNITDVSCSMKCNTSSPQYIHDTSKEILDKYCQTNDTCNLITDLSSLDNVTLEIIDNLTNITNTVRNNYINDCVNNNASLFGIGHPLYGGDDVINEYDGEAICCFGDGSCKYSDALVTRTGHIYCLAYQSCNKIGLIWTGSDINRATQSSDSEEEEEKQQQANIYCMGQESCSDSTLQGGDNVLCSSYSSCKNSFIVEARSLYCAMAACHSSFIRKVKNIYFIDFQGYVIVYSGFIGTMNVYFRGDNAGMGVYIYCLEGDECNIDCGENSCSSQHTTLFCDGKCFVSCNATTTRKNCVYIETSQKPSEAPTSAPTGTPTTAPTVTDSPLITQEQLSAYFNWVLGSLIGFSSLMLLVGWIFAFAKHNNGSFKWDAIIVFAVYAIDFFSDLFFCGKLYILWTDERLKYNDYYFVLLCLSILFLVVPMISNIVQLHNEVGKWTKDDILIEIDMPGWISTYMKFVFIIALICGSSFSAVNLSNSRFLEMSLFTMNLPQYHRKLFETKRFFSIVLFENVCKSIFNAICMFSAHFL